MCVRLHRHKHSGSELLSLQGFFTPSNLLVPPVRSAEIEKAVIASIISASAVHYGSCVTAGVCVFLIK